MIFPAVGNTPQVGFFLFLKKNSHKWGNTAFFDVLLLR